MSHDILDVHAHCVPRSLYERINDGDRSFGIAVAHTDTGPRWTFDGGAETAPIEPLLIDLDARVTRMDASGVAVQLISSFIDIGAHQVANDGLAYAETFNDALHECVTEHPTRLLGLGSLPLRDPDASVRELRRLIEDLGFVGVEVPAACATQVALEPVWAEARRLGAVVLVHPEASTTSTLPYFIGNFVTNPAESTAAAASFILSGVLERQAGLAVVLVHGGGFLPYQFGRMVHGFAQYGGAFGATASISPRDQLRLLHYDTVLHDANALAYLVDVVGHDRVVAGTDDPFAMGDAAPAATIAGIPGLSEEQRRRIRHDNLARLLERVRNDSWARVSAAAGDGGDAGAAAGEGPRS